ncbi:MAG: hypothetical protein ACXABN_19100 [Candidatus Thorarchaeota archaeon]|jgi:hypothetical protein
MPGLIVRKDDGDLKWFPFFHYEDGRYRFYPPKGKKTGREVGREWEFLEYIPGFWTPGELPSYRRRIGGGSSLITLDDEGDLRFYPFKEETFIHRGTGDRVGKGFDSSLDYYSAEWLGNSTSDLLVRTDDGDLKLFPWNGKEFKDLGRKEKVGNGFNRKKVPDIYPGYWTGGETPDIMIRKDNGDLIIFPFDGESFYGQDNIKIGRGFKQKDYPHLLIGHWLGNSTPDVLAYRDKRLYLFTYDGKNDFSNKEYSYRSDKDFREDWTYLVGHWRNPGSPDLIVVNGSNDLQFYPFDGQQLVDLRGERQVGNDWKVSHFWDFYPI